MEFLTKVATAFDHGGFWMWPILGFQLASIAIMLERVYALFISRKVDQSSLVTGLEEPIRSGKLSEVESQVAQSKAPVLRAALAGVQVAKGHGGRDEIQGKMDEVLLVENAKLDRRVGFLAMLGNVATLTGLLGTITGMIKSFAAVAFANPAEKASLLSAGISEAMNATAYGLIVAIPALVAYAILQNRSNHLAEDLNQAALRVYNWLSYAYDPLALRQYRVNQLMAETATQSKKNSTAQIEGNA